LTSVSEILLNVISGTLNNPRRLSKEAKLGENEWKFEKYKNLFSERGLILGVIFF